ncbi:MAG: hypothetical protein ACK40W_00270 [Allorhizobium sp.]
MLRYDVLARVVCGGRRQVHEMRMAIGSSLVAVTALGMTAIFYGLLGLVNWRIATLLVAGGIDGTMLAQRLSSHKATLTCVFAGIVATVGIYLVPRGYSAVFG